ncbi:hypothetical protein KFK09_005039 [Dendrobium nobile]|uniref:Uncharacterized protein n=1 Tax=Dendrobium nobile TaxID=94219 RepID=A0A8T3BUM5_DENNO|nr:hypothetical protein KFK09_005039 [Dendrobium nobile]
MLLGNLKKPRSQTGLFKFIYKKKLTLEENKKRNLTTTSEVVEPGVGKAYLILSLMLLVNRYVVSG